MGGLTCTCSPISGIAEDCPLHGANPIEVGMTIDLDKMVEQLTQHSIEFNDVMWKVALALGDVDEDTTQIHAEPREQIERLIAQRDILRRSMAEIVNVLGPVEICDCDHDKDCGLADEAADALGVAKRAIEATR